MPSSTTRPQRILLLIITSLLMQAAVAAQSDQPKARKIVSDDFTKNRTATKNSTQESPGAGRLKPKRPKRTYILAAPLLTELKRKTVVAQLGVTIWRLRPAKTNEIGARMLVREKNQTSECVPERVEADTIFREGDQLRLSVESPQQGYLYVVDRELLSDGSAGPAMLIYPWVGMPGNNQVGPGKLIDIPAQEDSPSYFTAKRSSTNHVGEILTFIVSSTPLDLPMSDKPLQISDSDLAKWERSWGGLNERFEMEDGAGQAWTTQEQQAAAHTGARQLTRDDPSPQTIYRISVADSKAFLVNVRLRYDRQTNH